MWADVHCLEAHPAITAVSLCCVCWRAQRCGLGSCLLCPLSSRTHNLGVGRSTRNHVRNTHAHIMNTANMQLACCAQTVIVLVEECDPLLARTSCKVSVCIFRARTARRAFSMTGSPSSASTTGCCGCACCCCDCCGLGSCRAEPAHCMAFCGVDRQA